MTVILTTVMTTSSFGALILFDDKAAFLAQTGATAATTIPGTPTTSFAIGAGFTSGDLSFSLIPQGGFRFVINDVSTRLPGSELTISGDETFHIEVDAGAVFAFGFDFVEPQFDPGVGSGSTFRESMFSVTLKNGTTTVDSFAYTRPNDSAEFVGVWVGLGESFDRLEIVETNANAGDLGENEFFGQFYTGATPIPEPSTIILGSIGLLCLCAGGAWRAGRSRRTVF